MKKQLFSSDALLELLNTDELTLHPVVFLFPELNACDFESLVNSIRAHGQIDPVWITNENQVIDGRHRWRAAQKLGVPVQCRRLKNYTAELLSSIIDHVISTNVTRRHMNNEQRSVVAATLEKKRVKAVAAQERGELSLDGGSAFSWHTFDELLKTFKINKAQYKSGVSLVEKGTPELVDAVANGALNLNVAMRAVRKGKTLTPEEIKQCLADQNPRKAIMDCTYAKFDSQEARNKKLKEKKQPRKTESYKPPVYLSKTADIFESLVCGYSNFDSEETVSDIESLNWEGVWGEFSEEDREFYLSLIDIKIRGLQMIREMFLASKAFL